MRKTHGNREKKRRIHDDRVKVNDRKNPSKSKEESRQFEKRKKVLFDFINDDLYVPMKIKEIAVVLQIPGEQRQELREVLDALVEEGKITISKRGKYTCGRQNAEGLCSGFHIHKVIVQTKHTVLSLYADRFCKVLCGYGYGIAVY